MMEECSPVGVALLAGQLFWLCSAQYASAARRLFVLAYSHLHPTTLTRNCHNVCVALPAAFNSCTFAGKHVSSCKRYSLQPHICCNDLHSVASGCNTDAHGAPGTSSPLLPCWLTLCNALHTTKVLAVQAGAMQHVWRSVWQQL